MASVNAIVGGANVVLRNLKRRNDEIGKGTARGLKMAGLRLQRASQLLVPVDFGILKNSAFTRHIGESFQCQVTVGYTAAYAIYVHENVEMKGQGLPRHAPSKGNYWDPAGRGQAKFLEQPARTMAPELRKIILKAAKIT